MKYEWFVEMCPNCETRNYLFWNSRAIWCLKCKWVQYREPEEEEENRHIPKGED